MAGAAATPIQAVKFETYCLLQVQSSVLRRLPHIELAKEGAYRRNGWLSYELGCAPLADSEGVFKAWRASTGPASAMLKPLGT